MASIQDLEVLKNYLSEEELKEIAKDVARETFKSSLGEANPHRKSNLEFYIKQGALQAVEEYMVDFDKTELAQDMKEKTKVLIKDLSQYQLPDTYRKIAEETIETERTVIEDKIKYFISNFVNSDNYDSVYASFQDKVGEKMADLLYSLLESNFKKKE